MNRFGIWFYAALAALFGVAGALGNSAPVAILGVICAIFAHMFVTTANRS